MSNGVNCAFETPGLNAARAVELLCQDQRARIVCMGGWVCLRPYDRRIVSAGEFPD